MGDGFFFLLCEFGLGACRLDLRQKKKKKKKKKKNFFNFSFKVVGEPRLPVSWLR